MSEEEEGIEEDEGPMENEKERAAREQLNLLNDYVTQMAYKPVEPPKLTDNMEVIAKPTKKNIAGTYYDYKDTLKPKERSERVKSIVQGHTPITIENLEKFIQKHREKQAQLEKNKKQQQIKYHETLLKLQKQCENQLMNAIIDKFVKCVTKKACSGISQSNVETESYQRLHNSLFCDMILALQIPNGEQSRDYKVYKKLAAVFADLILQALFLAHSSEGKDIAATDETGQQLQQMSNEKDLVIKLRSKRAAKKKLDNCRRKCSQNYMFMAHHFT